MAADTPPTPPANGKKKLLIPALIGGVVLIAALAGGGVFLMTGHKSDAKAGDVPAAAAAVKLPAIYLPLAPSFVVNLNDNDAMRYLQMDIEVMNHDPLMMEDVKANMPHIRNALMMLFSQQHYHDIVSREGKEALQKQAFEEVQKVLKEETGKPGVEALYFTNFVMQ